MSACRVDKVYSPSPFVVFRIGFFFTRLDVYFVHYFLVLNILRGFGIAHRIAVVPSLLLKTILDNLVLLKRYQRVDFSSSGKSSQFRPRSDTGDEIVLRK